MVDENHKSYHWGNTDKETTPWKEVIGPILGFWARGTSNHDSFRQFGLRVGDPCAPNLSGFPLYLKPGDVEITQLYFQTTIEGYKDVC
jgi:hypothetical protein